MRSSSVGRNRRIRCPYHGWTYYKPIGENFMEYNHLPWAGK